MVLCYLFSNEYLIILRNNLDVMAISTSKSGRIAIIGASGYGGLQLVKLINEHPNFDISTLNGERSVGKRWNEIKEGHDSCHGYMLFWGSKPKRKHLRWDGSTIKNNSVNFLKGMTISPKDMGLDKCPPDREGNDFGHDLKGCYQHSAYSCGISVDSVGYSICAMGGAIDGMLELGVRTKDLSKLFDKEFALKQTCDLCDNCGFQYDRRTNQINWELQDNIKVVNHTHMSPTWYNALIKRKETK